MCPFLPHFLPLFWSPYLLFFPSLCLSFLCLLVFLCASWFLLAFILSVFLPLLPPFNPYVWPNFPSFFPDLYSAISSLGYSTLLSSPPVPIFLQAAYLKWDPVYIPIINSWLTFYTFHKELKGLGNMESIVWFPYERCKILGLVFVFYLLLMLNMDSKVKEKFSPLSPFSPSTILNNFI